MDNYLKMWDDFGAVRATTYSGYKFMPTYRIGLTNYLREKLIYQFFEPQKDDIILDAGCASGKQIIEISKLVKEAYGTDIYFAFINKAKQIVKESNFKNIHFEQAQVEKLPFKNNFFNKIICAEVLEHVIDKNLALHELIRVLANNGVLIITVPNMNSDGTLWRRFLRILKIRNFVPIDNFSKEELLKHGDAHIREFDKDSLILWLKKNGLVIADIKSVSFIDGPYFDTILKYPLHVSILRKIIIKFEFILTNFNLFFGRHLVVKAIKNEL